MPADQEWTDLTSPSQWNGGIGVPFPARAWNSQDGVLSTSTRTWQSLYSKKQYRDFELEFEWKLAPGSNSGVKYLCTEGMLDPDWQASVDRAPLALGGLFLAALLIPLFAWRISRKTWLRWTLSAFAFAVFVAALSGSYLYFQARSRIARVPPGFEFQLIDNTNYRISLHPEQLTGSLYDLIPAPPSPPPAMNEWHQARIVVRDGKAEHWMDGRKVIEFEIGSPGLRQAVERSKFRRVAGFAERRSGYLQLQAHDGAAAFRSIRIRTY